MTALVLADTGPLYALADPSDQYHRRAAGELEAIQAEGLGVAVMAVTLCEAYTLVLRRLGGAYSRHWLSELLSSSALVHPEPAEFLLAAAQLRKFPDHPVTLVDAVTAVMSRRLDVPVWSFDRHFTTMRTKLWNA